MANKTIDEIMTELSPVILEYDMKQWDVRAEIEAGRRLWDDAEVTCEYHRRVPIAMFLLGLYNGWRFLFDLRDIRYFSQRQHEDALLLLRWDRWPMDDLHVILGEDIDALVKRWDIIPAR